MSKYVKRVKIGETRELQDAVATRVEKNPEPECRASDMSVADDPKEIPFPKTTFKVSVTRYLDFKWSGKDDEKGYFASHGQVLGTRLIGPNATWDEIEAEAVRLNKLGEKCFGETNHVFFEGGWVKDGVFYVFFGS